MPIVLAIALLISGGTAIAAESSLPGDTLYTVKVEVNERVQGWLAFDSASEANLNVKLAERRLEEAESLAAQGRLNAETQTEVEARFNERAERAQILASQLEAEGNFESSLNVSSGLEAMLRAHELVLRGVLSANPEAEASINAVLRGVEANTTSSIEARSKTEANLSARANAEFEAAARGKMTAAENKIAEVKQFFEKKSASLDAELRAEAEARIEAAETVFAEGKAKLEARAYAEAFVLFNRALWLAQEAQLTLAAEGNLGIKIDLSDEESENENQNENQTEVNGESNVEIDIGL